MSRRFATLFLAVMASLSVALPAGAMPEHRASDPSARSRLDVKVSKGHVGLGEDGSVLVSLKTRCLPPLVSFELDISVRQEGVNGSVVMLGAGVPPCDGPWHRVDVAVPADVGSFTSGLTTVDAFLGAFDPVEGDLEALDTVTVQV